MTTLAQQFKDTFDKNFDFTLGSRTYATDLQQALIFNLEIKHEADFAEERDYFIFEDSSMIVINSFDDVLVCETDNFAAHEIIKDLLDDGYDYQDIKNALEDGEFLSTQDWTEEDIDDAHYICVERLRHA